MRIRTALAAGLIACAPMPLLAQDDPSRVIVMSPAEADDGGDEGLDAMMAMFGGLFATEPLTAEQEVRVPAARSVIVQMMPDGFYAEMMREMMATTMRPMFEMFSGPKFVIAERTGADFDAVEALDETEQRAIAALLDPAYETRADVMLDALSGTMVDAFEAIEEPMRDGLAKAYAKRFTAAQLGDIAAFFDTPTGRLYAQESMKLFADPEVMGASMQAMPAMVGGIGDMSETMAALEASLPAKATFADLSAAERDRIAQALGMTVEELATQMQAALDAEAAQAEFEADMAKAIVPAE